MKLRGRRSLLVLVVAAALVLVALAAAAWHFSEERRLARVVTRLLAGHTGLPVTVERAAVQGSALKLYGVRLAATPGAPLEVRIGEVDVAGGLLPLLTPAGRRLSITAVAAVVAVSEGGGGRRGAKAFADLEAAIRRLLDWPGALTLQVRGSELQRGGRRYELALTGDKTDDTLTLALALGPEGRALRADARSTKRGDGTVSIALDLQIAPRQLAGLWPAQLPSADALALRAEVSLLGDGQVAAAGRATLPATPSPAMVDFTVRYDAGRGTLTVSRYAVEWQADVRLAGQAEVSAEWRLAGTVRGTFAGSPVEGRGAYHAGSGAFDAELTVESFSLARTAPRLGLHAPPGEPTARRVVVRAAGVVGGHRPAATVDLTAQGFTTAALRSFPLDGALNASVALAPDARPWRPTRITTLTLNLSREGQSVATLTGASRGTALWPLGVEGKVDDLARVAPALPRPVTLAGSARMTGELLSLDAVEFRGTLEATIPRAEVTIGAPVQFTKIQATVPVAWGTAAEARTGSVTVERIAGYRLAVNEVTSAALVAEGRLTLPAIAYTQYGGKGQGWLEATFAGSTPFKTRLEARGVDLARLVRESGSQVAHVTGVVRYVTVAQQTAQDGFVAVVRVESERGGEVSVDAIEPLLSSAAVQEESSGVLRQTLENLRVFPYESLEGELRLTGNDGRLDLFLRGKKRLGIFPAPVEAINLRNVPLTVLARTFSRGTTP